MKRYSEKAFHSDASDLNHEAYGEGCKHYNNKDFNRAKNSFEIALEYWPLDPQALMALGNCFDELNKPSRAEKCYRKSLKYSAEKDIPSVLYNLGNSLFDQGKMAEAIECYSKISGQNEVYSSAQRNSKLAHESIIKKNS